MPACRQARLLAELDNAIKVLEGVVESTCK
jgi:hypothetical protein